MGDLELNRGTRGKVAITDYDFWLTQSTDLCLYCLSKRQIAILMTGLPMSEWRTRWFSPTGAAPDMDLIQAEIARIETELMTDHCDLDTSLAEIITKLDTLTTKVDNLQSDVTEIGTDVDNVETIVGATQVTVNSISTAVTNLQTDVTEIGTDVDSIESTVNGISVTVSSISTAVTNLQTDVTETGTDVDSIENTVNALKLTSGKSYVYDNGPIEIIVQNFITFTASTLDTTTSQAYARYNAFCAAVTDWMYTEAYAVMTVLDSSSPDLGALALLMSVYAQSLAVQVTPGNPPYDISTIYNAFNDTTAVNAVACAIITQLANQTPTYDNFAAMLTAYSPPAYPDHRYVIALTLSDALQYLDGFNAFMQLLQSHYATAVAAHPTGYVCPPCIPSGLQTWDFTLGQKAPWLIQYGAYVSGLGISSVQLWIPSFAVYHTQAHILLSEPISGVSHVLLTVYDDNNTEGRGTSGANRGHTLNWTDSGGTVHTPANIADTAAAVAVLDFNIATATPVGPKNITQLEFFSSTHVWHHYYQKVQLT